MIVVSPSLSFKGSLNQSSGWLVPPPKPSIDQQQEKPAIHEEYELMQVNIPPRQKSLLSLGGVLATIAGVFYAVSPAPVPKTPPPVETPQVQTEPASNSLKKEATKRIDGTAPTFPLQTK